MPNRLRIKSLELNWGRLSLAWRILCFQNHIDYKGRDELRIYAQQSNLSGENCWLNSIRITYKVLRDNIEQRRQES